MADSPTQEFKTSGGHILVLNEYITGADNWQIKQIYMRALKAGAEEADTALEVERRYFELVICSLDGSTENIADRVLALPLPDYREVAEAVTPIIEAKKKPQAS